MASAASTANAAEPFGLGSNPRSRWQELAAKVDRACVAAGLEPDRRAFHPHITLARYRRSNADAARLVEQKQSDLASQPFAVTSFILFESHLSRHGAHYEEVASYDLG